MSGLPVQILHGSGIGNVIDDLARLRITVFREYPYLYDGSMEYEKHYLQAYLDCPESIVALVWDEDQVVGASTGLPLTAADHDFQKPFLESSRYPVEDLFYCAESVLLPAYRGGGYGRRFFQERESFAAGLNRFTHTCFCAVERLRDHPARPANYRDHTTFWEGLGYQKQTDLSTSFVWKEIGEPAESHKLMVFWTKSIAK
jgi:GNAT superfamily N-acetyltransferase